jgi:hypothetical protein
LNKASWSSAKKSVIGTRGSTPIRSKKLRNLSVERYATVKKLLAMRQGVKMRRSIVLVHAIVVMLLLTGTARSIIWNVHPDSTISSIQAGIDSSSNGDTVLVYPEAYFENVSFNGKNIVLASLFLTTADSSYISSTTIDGDAWGPVMTFENGEDSTALLTGFTIQNGTAWQGAGIYCYESSPSLDHLHVTGNEATLRGGGISCYWNANPRLTHVDVSGNSAPDGGGIYCYHNSSPHLSNLMISGNDADEGGGIYCYSSSAYLTGVTITGNTASERGGGIASYLSSPIFQNISASGNSAFMGGAIYCVNSSPVVMNTIVEGNDGAYGGMVLDDCPDAQVTYGDFYDNANFDFFGDVPQEMGVISGVNANGDSCDMYFNIFLNPLFVDPDNGDYHLQAGSPCIDGGDPSSPPDPDSTVADIGAFYHHQVGIWDDDQFESVCPSEFRLLANFPNPVRDKTTIQYEMPEAGYIRIRIYNLLGQQTRTLVDEQQHAGHHSVTWDGRDNSGEKVPGGLYFLRLGAGPIGETYGSGSAWEDLPTDEHRTTKLLVIR